MNTFSLLFVMLVLVGLVIILAGLKMSRKRTGFIDVVLEVILYLASILYVISIVSSFFYRYGHNINIPLFLYLNKRQIVTYGVGLLAAWVVYSQILSLRRQLQVQALIEYSKMWNSPDMITKRQEAMSVLKLDNVTADTVN